jgi:hypothetical protein
LPKKLKITDPLSLLSLSGGTYIKTIKIKAAPKTTVENIHNLI